jgi:hypothetical protein
MHYEVDIFSGNLNTIISIFAGMLNGAFHKASGLQKLEQGTEVQNLKKTVSLFKGPIYKSNTNHELLIST